MKKGKTENKSAKPSKDKAEEVKGQIPAEQLMESSEAEEQKSAPKEKVGEGEVLVRIKPNRGIGGYGQAGWEGGMPKELAEQYAAEDYLEILE